MRRTNRPSCAESLEQRMLLSIAPVGPEFRVNSFTTGSQVTQRAGEAAAMDGDGDFVVVWTSLTQDSGTAGVYAQRFDAAGSARGSEFRVNIYTTNDQSLSSVAMDADGDFVVTWSSYGQDGSDQGVFAQRFAADGTRRGVEFRVNQFTTGQQGFSKVAMDVDGDFVIVWSSDGQDGSDTGIYARRYDADGIPQGGEFRVNQATTMGQRYPVVAMNLTGDFVVCWASYHSAIPANIYARRYDASGTALGNEFLVNSTTADTQRYPAVALAAGGDFVIAWDSLSQDGSGYGVYAQRYNAAGAAQGSELAVNTFTNSDQQYPVVASDTAGNFVVSWQSHSQDAAFSDGVYGQAFSAAGAAQGAEFRINTTTTNDQSYPSIAMDREGDFVVVWTDYQLDGNLQGVFAQRYEQSTDVAPPLATEVLIADDRVTPLERMVHTVPDAAVRFSENLSTAGGTGGANSVTNPANWMLTRNGVDMSANISGITFGFNSTTLKYEALVSFTTALGEGTYVLKARDLIRDLADNALDGDFSGSAGGDFLIAFVVNIPTAAGAEFRVNTYTTDFQQIPAVALDDAGDFVIVWNSAGQDGSNDGVYAQRYNATGTPQGGEFRVNSYTTAFQGRASVALDANGDFVIVWESGGPNDSGSGIYAQRYNSAGVPQGSEFSVNTYTTSDQAFSSVGMDRDGNFVVAWSSYGQDGSSWGVYAQRYNAAGVAQGTEFRVNTYTTNFQETPRVALSADGNFVIAWESSGQDGSATGVYAQRYDATGTAQASEFRVNTYTTGTQRFPAISMDAAGDFVIAWQSSGQDGSDYGVYAQRYSAAGAAQGDEFRVNTYTTAAQRAARVALDDDGDFVVAWDSDGQDGSGQATVARRYDTSGDARGNEFRVNTYTTSNQFNAAVAADADGDFVIAWTSNGQDGSQTGIYAQRFADATPPVVESSEFLYQTAPHRLRFTFSEDVSASLSISDLLVQTLPSGPAVTPSALSYDRTTNTATFTFASILLDANYRATLNGAGILDQAGNSLGPDYSFDFFFLNGDANRDRTVNLLDFNILALNFGQSNRNFAQGDFNYDTVVDLLDFNILASHFGTSVAPGTFSASRIGSSRTDRPLIDTLRDDLLA